MLFQLTKAPWMALLCGLCLSLQVNANAQGTVETYRVTTPSAVDIRPLTTSAEDLQAVQSALPQGVSAAPAAPRALTPPAPQSAPATFVAQSPAEPNSLVPGSQRVRIALLLPLRSSALGPAAEALRAGFYAAYERGRQGIEVTLVETGDAPQDVLTGYRNASMQHDIVVGPFSRSGVAALARSGEVMRPTIALAAPDTQEPDLRLPPQMLVMGLAIEDEARQVADWARRDHANSTAYVVHTKAAWQRRAARAFATHWNRHGVAVKLVELEFDNGFLGAGSLQQLRQQLNGEQSAILFAALDAGQARQLRESIGRDLPLYGTSQLNPVALVDRSTAEPVVEMEGAHLLDIPWQLQADHPAVMIYPRLAIDADQKRNADLERVYALGIDAFRVARELAAQHTNFVLDGVTGRLVVRFDRFGPFFERTSQQAVYRDGNVTAAGMPN